MSIPPVTIEIANDLLANPPTLHPRPNGTNIRALVQWYDQKLGSIPSQQSREHGYSGMTTQTEVYALKSNTPWRDTPDPGPHRPIDPSLNTAGQNDAEVEFKFNKSVFDSEQNIKRAVIASLNKAVPKEYRRITGGSDHANTA